MTTKEEALQRVRTVFKHVRYAVKEAAKEGDLQMGILSVKPGGGGRITARFDCKDFLEDLALVLDIPPQTEADDKEASFEKFFQGLGLR